MLHLLEEEVWVFTVELGENGIFSFAGVEHADVRPAIGSAGLCGQFSFEQEKDQAVIVNQDLIVLGKEE